MGHSIQIIVFLALLKTISTAYYLDTWFARISRLSGNDRFKSGENHEFLVSNPSTDLTSKFTCYSIIMNGEAWGLEADFSSRVSGKTEFAVGYWVKFTNTVSNKLFQFGIDSGPHYIISSASNGALNGVFNKDASTTDQKNNFSFTIPLNKWNLIAFDFLQVESDVTLNILIVNKGKTSITSDASSSIPFQLPKGYMFFSSSVHGWLYRAFAQVSAYFVGTEYRELIVKDINNNVGNESTICSVDCADDLCSSPDTCVSNSQHCQCAQGSTTCNSCDEPARDPSSSCSKCTSGNYLRIITAALTLLLIVLIVYLYQVLLALIVQQITSSTRTEQAVYLASVNSILACTDSCSSCSPNPQCFKCASLIVQDGSTCRVDKVGYQLSFDEPNIVIDFANSLNADMTINSIKASSGASPSTPLTTTGWTLNACKAGATQCSIVTDLTESQLPISLELKFNQV